jgi:hypothetical protein
VQGNDQAPLKKPAILTEAADFTVVVGGPLYQAFLRTRLSGVDLELVHRRIVFLVLVGWLPLVFLTAIAGNLVGESTTMPFLLDAAVQVRFLLVVPLLLSTEVLVHERIRKIVAEFHRRNLVPDTALGKFYAAIESASRLRNSMAAELILVAVVYAMALTLYRPFAERLGVSTWFITPADSGMTWTPAGQWYSLVSMPLFQFLVVRWYYRILIWARFLWQVSQIPLRLVPMHPDRLGGLGFIVAAAGAFTPLAMAHGALLSGMIANRILHLGQALPQFTVEIAAVLLVVWVIVFGPLMVFSFQLAQAKRAGLLEYGRLAETYVRGFDGKWVRGTAPTDEPLLGSSDVQSLADMGNSYSVVREMSALPVSRDAILRVSAAALVPLGPLLLTMMPLAEILKRLAGMFF